MVRWFGHTTAHVADDPGGTQTLGVQQEVAGNDSTLKERGHNRGIGGFAGSSKQPRRGGQLCYSRSDLGLSFRGHRNLAWRCPAVTVRVDDNARTVDGDIARGERDDFLSAQSRAQGECEIRAGGLFAVLP